MHETRTEDWREWGKTGDGRGYKVIERRNNGVRQVCVRVPAGVCDGRIKNERLLGNKLGQSRDVGTQRRNVTERV